MSPKQALAFVREHGAVLEAARGPLPSLAVAIAGGPIRGSWWGHPKGHEIFQAAQAVTESGEVLTCRLADGKVTYVHRRLWPALVKLAPRFRRDQLARVWSEHTASGAHRNRREAFPRWVPREVLEQAARLTEEDAERLLAPSSILQAQGPRVEGGARHEHRADGYFFRLMRYAASASRSASEILSGPKAGFGPFLPRRSPARR